MLYWWRTWHDDQRRLWAERHHDGDPATAKRTHSTDKQYLWVEAGMHAPAVGPLIFTDPDGRDAYVAASSVRETDTDRNFMSGATPPPPTTRQPTAPPPPPQPTYDDLPF